MSANHEEVESLLRFLKRKKGTLSGLIVILVLLNSGFFAVTIFLRGVLENTRIVVTPHEYGIFYLVAAAFFITLNTVAAFTWDRWRRPPKFSFEQAGILFAPHSTVECTDLVEALYERFSRDLVNRGLTSKISSAMLPPNEIVLSHEDAQNLLKRTGAQVIIHGLVDEGQVNGNKRSGFTSISFTVRNLIVGKTSVYPIIAALNEMNFQVREANSMLDKDVVAQNLADTSCFFVATALMLQQRQVEARLVFDELRRTLGKRVAAGKKIQALKSLADHWWRVNELLFCHLMYAKRIRPVLGTDKANEIAIECRAILENLRKANFQPFDIDQFDALFLFHLGDVKKARRICEDLEKKATNKSSAPCFSLAFLALWQNKWRIAIRYYRKAEKAPFNLDVVMSVLDFLESIAANRGDKLQLKFALAIVNDMFFDQERAKADYRTFVDAVKDSGGDFAELLDHAQRRLIELEKRSLSVLVTDRAA